MQVCGRRISVLLTSVALLCCVSCGAIDVTVDEYAHMICADSDGRPAEVRIKTHPRIDQAHHAHAAQILEAYRKWRDADPTGKRRRVMLVIHGGLVRMSTAVTDARRVLAAMQAAPPSAEQGESFPIFVNWETGMGRSWLDHMFYVRAGERNTVWATATSPFVLAADLGKAIARYPLTLALQGQSIADYYRGRVEAVPGSWKRTVAMDPAVDSYGFWSNVDDVVGEIVPGVLRPVTSLLLDTAGIPAYRNMRRRGRVLFVLDEDYDHKKARSSGAMSILMERFVREARDSRRAIPVTVLAHSMGCGVANDLIHRFGPRRLPRASGGGAPPKHALEMDRIVYMGAACSIREFAQTVLPYIRQGEARRFYNLCLHPLDEQDDRYAMGAAPHGSLLEWIDDFITDQETKLDRTLGKWNNIVAALPLMAYLPRGVRDRIFVRGFARRGDTPRDHGHFNDVQYRFWKWEFWHPHGIAPTR